MILNYLKVAWRNLMRSKVYSFINIFGLAIGIACSILIFQWVRDEMSYDRFNPDFRRIYRVINKAGDAEGAITTIPFAEAIHARLPQVEATLRLRPSPVTLTAGDRKFAEARVFYADTNFFSFFNYPLLEGDARSALLSPDGIVITEETAMKYFGTTAALNKIIRLNDKVDLFVKGVLRSIPKNSHLTFDILLPMRLYTQERDIEWDDWDLYTYVRFRKNVPLTSAMLSTANKEITDIYEQHSKYKISFHLQALADVHLHSTFSQDVSGQGSIRYVTTFSIIAVFILLIACVNFMNLATALSGRRAKEVGLRKTIGASKSNLAFQYLGESVLVAFLALFLSIIIIWVVLPWFNELAGKELSLLQLLTPGQLALYIGIAIFAGIMGGVYPAFYLASFQTIKVLKGNAVLGKKSRLGNLLVVFQFTIAIVLMIATMVVYDQLHFIRSRDIGYNKSDLLYVALPKPDDSTKYSSSLGTLLGSNPMILSSTTVNALPTDLTTGSADVSWPGKSPQVQILFPNIAVDEDFLKTFGMHMESGRFFETGRKVDSGGYVINEAAIKVMGMTVNDAIGKYISFDGNRGMLIGVVKDFNFKPAYQPIEPLIIRYRYRPAYLVVRFNSAYLSHVASSLKETFRQVYGNTPFTFGFVDEDLANQYRSEQMMGKLFNIFSILAIIISCLGLFGLATFTAQRRLKEIAIRRVLGATVVSVVRLLTMDFVKLIVVSACIAFPLAWLVMNKWLQGFAYRVGLQWWVFITPAIFAVIISLVPISFQIVKAALMNPVKNIKAE